MLNTYQSDNIIIYDKVSIQPELYHSILRGETYKLADINDKTSVFRQYVKNKYTDWSVDYVDYSPTWYSSYEPIVSTYGFNNPNNIVSIDPLHTNYSYGDIKFNQYDFKYTADRRSHHGPYNRAYIYPLNALVPLNPHGRVGIAGKGLLPKWGPNHRSELLLYTKYSDGIRVLMCVIGDGDSIKYKLPGIMVNDHVYSYEAAISFVYKYMMRHVKDLKLQNRSESDKTVTINEELNVVNFDKTQQPSAVKDVRQGSYEYMPKDYSDVVQFNRLYIKNNPKYNSGIIYKGAVSDELDTDNAWVESILHCREMDYSAKNIYTLYHDLKDIDMRWILIQDINSRNIHTSHLMYMDNITSLFNNILNYR